jgi:hypothetical protein
LENANSIFLSWNLRNRAPEKRSLPESYVLFTFGQVRLKDLASVDRRFAKTLSIINGLM